MSGDETVRDRVARWHYEREPITFAGTPCSWGGLNRGARERHLVFADALLAAFPELVLFERLEAWMSDDPLRRDVWITKRRGGRFDVLIAASGSGLGPGNERGEGFADSPAAALSAALDQVAPTTNEEDR